MTISNGVASPNVAANGHRRSTSFFQDHGIWKEAPVLIGTTRFEPRPDVRNIMITGGAGFIACWLVRHLTLTYPHAYNIVSFDKLDYCSSLNNTRMLDGRRNFAFYQGDVTNPAEVVDCLERYNIDTIVHFAAQSHVDLSFGNSYTFTHTNVYGTHVLLESARKMRIKRFIHISTDEVYGEVDDDDDDLLESSILAPTNPYAASKAAAEMLVHSYQKSFKLPAIIVRSNNVYGPHQYPRNNPQIHLPPRARRPGSPARRRLADAALPVYNVGAADELSNLALCRRLLAAFRIAPADFPRWIRHTHDRPFNDRRYAVDAAKLRALGWEPQTAFDDGLGVTVAWYRRFGLRWWGDVAKVLTPFPVVAAREVVSDHAPVSDNPQQDGWGWEVKRGKEKGTGDGGEGSSNGHV
ncbi:NAD(P)-binding protein [Trichocladium antarcticum]|uniref:NAD(P)-binding protein n=1 Tax=Trichocladium antarcticum TaxID=1450529 RepID=A0AAN6ZEX1_9PEZI|nr:NAD(P)-binding protein [Trichocladium antarcticum]